MPSLAERQRQFGQAILDARLPVPAGLAGPCGSVRAERFAVYRNNVAVGLIEALRCAFPVVERLVGREFFAVMARAHALQSPPSSPVLLEYGSGFPDFIAHFEPAAALPCLGDVARLEWYWLESFHAAEAAPLAMQDLHGIAGERLPTLKLRFHPAARILGSVHPVFSIWQLHQQQDEPYLAGLDVSGEAVLVVRPHAIVEAMKLSSGALVFLNAIHADGTIGEAAMAALEMEPGLDLAVLFPFLFRAGTFAGFVDERKSIASGEWSQE